MFKWLKRGLLALLGLLLIGCIYQAISASRDAGRFHPPGRLIDVDDGRRMHLDCRGNGAPTVLLETGLGGPAVTWNDVLTGLAPITRVCAYDRAGYGYSDAGPLPRTTNVIVDDLERLLAAAGEHGPYVLAGHSFGGFTVRVFAARHRALVQGMVLVDSSHPEQVRRMPQNVRRRQDTVNAVSQALPILCRVGIVRAALTAFGASPELAYLESQPGFAHAYLSELNALSESGAQVMAAATSFGDLPLTVLTAGKEGAGSMPEMYALWRNELQPELVKLSTTGRQIIVNDSTHLIPMEKPRAVIEAVRDMLAGIKQ